MCGDWNYDNIIGIFGCNKRESDYASISQRIEESKVTYYKKFSLRVKSGEGDKLKIFTNFESQNNNSRDESLISSDAGSIPKITTEEKNVSLSDERDIVLVLDVSGSMGGTPIEETRKASGNFIDTILDEDANIGIVTYNGSAATLADFSRNKIELNRIVSNIYSDGGTNIEAGLSEAYSMLKAGNAKKKIIVLMSDGEPNTGKEGDALIEYADEIKDDGIIIYTLGFFESLGYKSSAQTLMEKIASDGCHYEVANADDLVFFFEDMADQINGQKYIYIRIACPVDVTVSYNGEKLCSAEKKLNLRTDFGTLTFEENEDKSNGADDRIKVLRLKEGADYDVQIVGTGYGHMNYTIGFMDENGDYSDLRKFRNIKITKKTEIDTVATIADESVLNIDEDGDGKYDLKLRATKNSYGEKVETYFEDLVGDSLDSFESSVGHNYKLSYEVNETYNLSERKLEALIDELGSGYYDFDLSVIEKVVVADVTVTAKKGSRSSKQDMNIVMSKEDGEWKLVYIDNE